MNGARSIFMRKGYWLTALAAIVLLAASPGTASSAACAGRYVWRRRRQGRGAEHGQPRARPRVYHRGASRATVPVSGNAGTLTVTTVRIVDTHRLMITVPMAETGRLTPFNPTNAWCTFASYGSSKSGAYYGRRRRGQWRSYHLRHHTVSLPTTQDADAEDEKFTLSFTPSDAGVKVSRSGERG